MGILLLKLFLSPALVAGATLAGRRWGPGVAGVFVGQPIVAGPILFITCLTRGPAFGAGAAAASLFGVASLALFAVVYARAAFRVRWPAALPAGYAAVLALDAALSFVRLPLAAVLALVLAAVGLALAAAPPAGPEPPAVTAPPRWDLPARAAVTGALVLAVTSASALLGPRWTGILAPFPVAMSVVVAFAHAQDGPRAAARALRAATVSLAGFAGFCAVAAALVRPLGPAAFVPAVAVSLAAQLAAVVAGRRRATARARRPGS